MRVWAAVLFLGLLVAGLGDVAVAGRVVSGYGELPACDGEVGRVAVVSLRGGGKESLKPVIAKPTTVPVCLAVRYSGLLADMHSLLTLKDGASIPLDASCSRALKFLVKLWIRCDASSSRGNATTDHAHDGVRQEDEGYGLCVRQVVGRTLFFKNSALLPLRFSGLTRFIGALSTSERIAFTLSVMETANYVADEATMQALGKFVADTFIREKSPSAIRSFFGVRQPVESSMDEDDEDDLLREHDWIQSL